MIPTQALGRPRPTQESAMDKAKGAHLSIWPCEPQSIYAPPARSRQEYLARMEKMTLGQWSVDASGNWDSGPTADVRWASLTDSNAQRVEMCAQLFATTASRVAHDKAQAYGRAFSGVVQHSLGP